MKPLPVKASPVLHGWRPSIPWRWLAGGIGRALAQLEGIDDGSLTSVQRANQLVHVEVDGALDRIDLQYAAVVSDAQTMPHSAHIRSSQRAIGHAREQPQENAEGFQPCAQAAAPGSPGMVHPVA